jgi:hypothetical protein
MYDLSQLHKEVKPRLINELRCIFKFSTIESIQAKGLECVAVIGIPRHPNDKNCISMFMLLQNNRKYFERAFKKVLKKKVDILYKWTEWDGKFEDIPEFMIYYTIGLDEILALIKEQVSDMASKLIASGHKSNDIDLNSIESNLIELMSGKHLINPES